MRIKGPPCPEGVEILSDGYLHKGGRICEIDLRARSGGRLGIAEGIGPNKDLPGLSNRNMGLFILRAVGMSKRSIAELYGGVSQGAVELGATRVYQSLNLRMKQDTRDGEDFKMGSGVWRAFDYGILERIDASPELPPAVHDNRTGLALYMEALSQGTLFEPGRSIYKGLLEEEIVSSHAELALRLRMAYDVPGSVSLDNTIADAIQESERYAAPLS